VNIIWSIITKNDDINRSCTPLLSSTCR